KVKVVVETFNSFCEKILLKYGHKIYGKRVRISKYEDKMIAVLKALENQNLNLKEALMNYYGINFEDEKIYELQKSFISDCFLVFEEFKLSNLSIEEFSKINFNLNDKNSRMILEI